MERFSPHEVLSRGRRLLIGAVAVLVILGVGMVSITDCP